MGDRAAPAVRVALALLVIGACLLAAGPWRVYSNTWDEPEHLAAGIELLDRGKYEYDTEHPPLGRILLALGPYLAGARSFGTRPPEGVHEGVDILYADGGKHYWRYLTLARLGMLPFLALLLGATWWWARRVVRDSGPALLAVALCASLPPLLGNGGLASLDVPAAATILLALYALQRWLEVPRIGAALIFGLAAGIAVATKFSAVPFIGLALVTLGGVEALLRLRAPAAPAGASTAAGALTPAATAPRLGRIAGLALAALAALVPLWLVYAPRALDPAGVATRFGWAVGYLQSRAGLDHVLGVVLAHLWLPRELKDLVNGIVAVKAHNDTGHLSYLLGEVRLGGWWYFYLVALAVKTPIPMLLAGPVGLLGLAREGWRQRDGWRLAPLVIVLTIIGFSSFFSRINIGVRHILIVYPFLALGMAWLVATLWRAAGALPRAGLAAGARAVILAGLLWQLSPAWRAYPDYLPYFNVAVRDPAHVLVDSDLDWGQDLYRLEQRAAALRIPHLAIAYRGTEDLTHEPLPPYTVLPGRHPVSGWVAVSALARTRRRDDYAWLEAYQPVERIGKTIDLYYVP